MKASIADHDWQQISLRQRMSPFPNYYSMETVSSDMRRVVGTAFQCVLLIYRENLQYVFLDRRDADRVGRFILYRMQKEPTLFHRLVKLAGGNGRRFLKFSKSQSRRNLRRLTNQELSQVHVQFEKLYKSLYVHYFPIFAVDGTFMREMRLYFDTLTNGDEKAAGYLNLMITEPRAMVARQEQIALLKLTLDIKHSKRWNRIIYSPRLSSAIRQALATPGLCRKIQAHEKRYYWITRDYEDPVMTFNDIVRRIRQQTKDKPLENLRRIEKENIKLPARRRQLVKQLGIDRRHVQLFDAAREGAHLKELRKTFVSQALYAYDPVLKEIARRGRLTLRQVRHLTTADVIRMLNRGAGYRAEAAARVKSMVLYVDRGRTVTKSGSAADKIFQAVYQIKADVKVIKGLAASPGKAKGRVRIIMDPQEGRKLKKGEVIVTAQAVPSFASFLSRAAALVAEGGTALTSHPATLAREAGIPGVTSAKVATQILKDGDLVEVDGNKGTVTRC